MALTPTYIRQQSIPQGTGQQMAPLSLASNVVVEAAAGVSDVLSAAASRIERRQDIVNIATAEDNFEKNELQEYTAFLDTADLRDNKSIDKYAAESEKRVQQILGSTTVSADARANLQASLRRKQSAYMMEVTRKANTTQRKVITDRIADEIAPIVSALTKNPANFRSAFGEIDKVVAKYADGVDFLTEEKARELAYSSVMENTVGGLLRRGDWEAANSMLDDNPLLSKYLQPSKREQFDNQISSFAAQEGKTQREMQGRRDIVLNLKARGINIDDDKALNYVVGADLSPNKSFASQVKERMAAFGINPETATPETQAAVMGIKLPGTSEIDPNKDYFMQGGKPMLTPQGASKQIKPYVEAATAIKTRINSIESLYREYTENGNEAAALGVLQGYLKLIDDGAVVRESDIQLAESTTSAKERVQKAIDSFTTGKGVSAGLVDNAINASRQFVGSALEISKSFIDGTRNDTGYRMIELGVPQDSYDMIFGDVRAKPKDQTASNDTPNPVAKKEIPSNISFVVGADAKVTATNAATGASTAPKVEQ